LDEKKEVRKPRRYFNNTFVSKSVSNKKLLETWKGGNPKPPLAIGWANWLERIVTKVTTCASNLTKD